MTKGTRLVSSRDPRRAIGNHTAYRHRSFTSLGTTVIQAYRLLKFLETRQLYRSISTSLCVPLVTRHLQYVGFIAGLFTPLGTRQSLERVIQTYHNRHSYVSRNETSICLSQRFFTFSRNKVFMYACRHRSFTPLETRQIIQAYGHRSFRSLGTRQSYSPIVIDLMSRKRTVLKAFTSLGTRQ